MANHIYSKYITTTGADEDILGQIKTELGLSNIVVKRLKMFSANSFTYDVSSSGVLSQPYLDGAVYKLETGIKDVAITSCVIHESGVEIWTYIEY